MPSYSEPIMAITVTERSDSRTYVHGEKTRRFVRRYNVRGTDDPFTAESYGPAIGDTYGANLRCNEKEAGPLVIDGTVEAGACLLTCTYVHPDETSHDPVDPADEFEWNTMAQMAHFDRAPYGQVHYPATEDVGGLVGADGDNIDGVDVFVPKGTYMETHERTTMPLAYRNIILQLGGTVNAIAFRGWAAGEVLFLGAVARKQGHGLWKVNYKFSVELNSVQSIELYDGSVETVPKMGWDYMWMRKIKEVSGGEVKYGVKSVHVAAVYPFGNFNLLSL